MRRPHADGMKRGVNVAPRTLHDLGFSEVLSALADRCRTPTGRERALARPFLGNAAEVQEALDRVSEASLLFEQQFQLPVGILVDVRPALQRAERRALLEPRDLLQVATALRAFQRTREQLEERERLVPALAAMGRRLPLMPQLGSRIEACFDGEGNLADHASPELRECRDRVRGLHRRIKERLDTLIHDESFTVNLREQYYSIRNERYVVPVKAAERAQVPGIVHNASQTGQTLFVEPEALIGLGNDLAIAQSLVLEEERRILQELTDAVGKDVERIREGVAAAAELDEAEAAARLAAELRARPPELQPGDGELQLSQLRHPLLVLRGKEVVPNDVRLGGSVRSLVISGPNAGGKTVTLTGVGLCALMLRAGLPVPVAEGSRMPLYGGVHSTVGDAQDIHQDLSTFSAHLVELRRIGERAGIGALVLIDEIAADTDPREGAALAIAVLEDLIQRGATVLVTTHLEELKALAHMDTRFLNARVGFDAGRMQPTYRLQLGVAGASSALEIAARMGLPSAVVERARALAEQASGPLSKALRATEEERRKLAEELQAASDARLEVERLRKQLLTERAELEQLRQQEEAKLHEQLAAEAEIAAHELRQLVSKLRAKPVLTELEQARKEVAAQVAQHQAQSRAATAQKEIAQQPGLAFSPRVGATVRHVGLDRDVEILQLHGNEALVAAGNLKLRASLAELAPPRAQKRPSTFPGGPSAAEKQQRAEAVVAKPIEAGGARVDVRGLRADEALRRVDEALDTALRRGEDSAVILHGHGTGALKSTLREHLDSSPYVRMFRPGERHEGGDAVTIVALRG